jgi:Flp pilus assembly pilin Flp
MNSKGSRIQGFKNLRGQGFKGSSGFNTLDPWTPRPLDPCLSKTLDPSTPRILDPCLRGQDGFTAIEVTMIVVVLAILAFSIGIKMDITGSKSAVAGDQLIADIQYIQMRAMGIGSSQDFTFNGSTPYSIYTISGEQKTLPTGVTVTTTFGNTLRFNSLGEPTVGGDGVIQVGSNKYIKVLDITGYVCNCKNSACNSSECLN